MDYKEALQYISSVAWQKKTPGLDRITELLGKMGNPQSELRFVHVAGTNGKGSICAMLASVLKKSGYKTGLFTSPYISRFNERMQINGKQIGDAEFAELVGEMKPLADSMEDRPTEFEMITATALRWFADKKCDIVVLEVGLGGRWDATNAISVPECAVIANIGLDHTALLGKTACEIAAEKAGIIKPGGRVVLYQQSYEVMELVREVCDSFAAELTVPDFGDIESEFDSLDGQVFSYRGESYAIPLLGEHQRYNAATALEAIDVLRAAGWELPPEAVEAGLYSVSWPARFEVVSDEPWFIVDGGHNPQCAEALAQSVENYFPESKRVLLLGILADKDHRKICEILAPHFDAFVCVTPTSPRALPAAELAEELKIYGKPLEIKPAVGDGVRTALELAEETDAVVCAAGSLYICGEIRGCFGL